MKSRTPTELAILTMGCVVLPSLMLFGCCGGCLLLGLNGSGDRARQPRSPLTHHKPPDIANSGSRTREATHETGDSIRVGGVSCVVWGSWWASSIDETVPLHPSKPMGLFVEVTVSNQGNAPRRLPSFMLVDDQGVEYRPDTKETGVVVQGFLHVYLIDTLDPSASARGYFGFWVPRNRTYQIKLHGEDAASDAYVRLAPATRGLEAARIIGLGKEDKEASREQGNAEMEQEPAEADWDVNWDVSPEQRRIWAKEQGRRDLERALRERDQKREAEVFPWRAWVDSTGRFSVLAQFIKASDGQVTLRKEDGTEITLPMDRLSQADQEWIRLRPR